MLVAPLDRCEALAMAPCAPVDAPSEPLQLRLANGLAVALLSRPDLPRAALSVRVAAGSHDEPMAFSGLAHFLEHLLFLGGAAFAGEQRLMPFVRACGGQLNASTQAHHSDYFCEVPAQQLEDALARLLDMLWQARLDPAAQRAEREVLHAEFLARSRDGQTLIQTALGQAVAAGHPLGGFYAGNRQTLAVEQPAFQQALWAFYRQHYQPTSMQLTLMGPQPLVELLALLQPYGQQRFEHEPPKPLVPAPGLLPLRQQALQLCLADSPPALHLAFALEYDSPQALVEALDFLQFMLARQTPGGVLEQLRAAGLCRQLRGQLVYQHQGQGLWLISCEETPEPERLAAALLDWLHWLTVQAPWVEQQAEYRRVRQRQLAGLGPLELARTWQAALLGEGAPHGGLSSTSLALLTDLLQQMQQPARQIYLRSSAEPAPAWPAAGFTLAMGTLPAPQLPVWQQPWCLPARNPWLARQWARLPDLQLPGLLSVRPGPHTLLAHDQAQIHWRCELGQALPLSGLKALLDERLQSLQRLAAEAGLCLQVSAGRRWLELQLSGAETLLPALLGQALEVLHEAEGAGVQPLAEADGQWPIRQLLDAWPASFAMADELAAEHSAGHFWMIRHQGQLFGGSAHTRHELQQLLAPGAPPAAPQLGAVPTGWQQVGQPGQEAALLLFCMMDQVTPELEAAWRLLAQSLQEAFYQRMRVELQLGYALFCGYRQGQGQRGILFAVQSPKADTAQLLAHSEALIAEQVAILTDWPAAQLRQAAAELGQRLHSEAPLEQAQQHWQAWLAGLPAGHPDAVVQACAALDQATWREALQQLEQAPRQILANQPAPR